MFLRAAAEAVLALLLGGALATRGLPGLLRPWDYLVPFGALFLCLELILRRKEAGAARVFLCGLAFACVYEGVYTKSVLDGLGILGTDAASLIAALFDWGMMAVMAAHLVASRWPRPQEPESRWRAVPALALLGVILLAMLAVYLVTTAFGHYVAERTIGPTWMLSDILFAVAAYHILRRALDRDEGEFPAAIYALCGFSTWAPGNQILLEWSDRFAWPAVLTFLLCSAWAAGAAWGFYRFWRWRGVVDEKPVRAHRFILYSAAWRVIGSLALLAAYHPGLFDERVASAYAVLIDVPTRLAFSYALLSARLEV
jgi:hypothetical protein